MPVPPVGVGRVVRKYQPEKGISLPGTVLAEADEAESQLPVHAIWAEAVGATEPDGSRVQRAGAVGGPSGRQVGRHDRRARGLRCGREGGQRGHEHGAECPGKV
jgi:hypothetical protein